MTELNKKPTNKLSIYLLKEGIDTKDDIFAEPDSVKILQLGEGATLYYSNSEPNPPAWLNKFFGNATSNQLKGSLYTAFVSAALIIDVQIDAETKRTFALTFGLGGWQLLKSGAYEERFGLMTTLNMVKPDSIRSIDKSNMGLSPKQAREQAINAGEIADFGVDIEQDLVRAITGKCVNPDHGSTITGKDSLHISSKVDISNIKEKLKIYYQASQMQTYKSNFAWIDNIAEVTDKTKVDQLNDLLIQKINSNNRQSNIWMAVPEVIDWSDVKGFVYARDLRTLSSDLDLDTLLGAIDEKGKDADLETLKKERVALISESSNHEVHSWSAYACLYAEVTHASQLYTLNNAKWYCVEKDFVAQVKAEYDAIYDATCELPNHLATDGSETNYNSRVASEMGLTLMDAKNIPYGGGHSKIEFCDLYNYPDKKLYHVKKYGGSSVLSHLFNQGLVSAQLMLSEETFRVAVNDKLPAAEKFSPTSVKPNPQDFEVVFAVISKSTKPLDIPFFSKVSLKNAKRNLELYGIKRVRLVKIQSEE